MFMIGVPATHVFCCAFAQQNLCSRCHCIHASASTQLWRSIHAALAALRQRSRPQVAAAHRHSLSPHSRCSIGAAALTPPHLCRTSHPATFRSQHSLCCPHAAAFSHSHLRPDRAAARVVAPDLALHDHFQSIENRLNCDIVSYCISARTSSKSSLPHKPFRTGRQAKSGSQLSHKEFQFVLALWRNQSKGTFYTSKGER